MDLSLEEQIRQYVTDDGDNKTSQPLTLDLGNGTVLNFKNTEDLAVNLKAALGNVNNEVQTLKQQISEYQAQLAAKNNQYASSDDDVSTEKLNVDTFIEKMRRDPREGFDYVDQFRENPYKKEMEEFRSMKQEMEANKFLAAHPEFQGQYANVLDATRQELSLPFNKAGLEAAYVHAQQQNRIPDVKTQTALNQQQQVFDMLLKNNGLSFQDLVAKNNELQQQQQQTNPYARQGIPTVPRGNSQQLDNFIADAERLPLEKLRELLQKNGAL